MDSTSPTSSLTTVAIHDHNAHDHLVGTRKHAIDFLVADIPPLKRARILSDLSQATESFTKATKASNNSTSIFSLPPFTNNSNPSSSLFTSTITTTTPSTPFFPSTIDSLIPPPPPPLSVASSIQPSTSLPQPPNQLFSSNPFDVTNSIIPIATGGAVPSKPYRGSTPPSLFSSGNFLLSNTSSTQVVPDAVAGELHKVEKRCSECSYASADGEEMIAHAKAAHPNKPYACKVCARCFGEKGNMNKHYRTVHLKQRKHGCGKCGRFFAFADGLNRHISMVHLDRRPFDCDHCLCPTRPHDPNIACTHICGMRFKQKSHRRRHVRSVHQAHFVAE